MRAWTIGGDAYDHDAAGARVREHGRDFVAQVVNRVTHTGPPGGGPPWSFCALDTELLGHWWYEGPHGWRR